eukprot:TRINITY_DN2322_c0_g1_i1.p1 TRINITY_DN2322_c0_g1~~TRINITY_DN2322_c0_g1_i1.p1  ORF type:complete len:271 (-),score=47.97 TRINITY_DN2322_c0_g1_i1:37-849(-)
MENIGKNHKLRELFVFDGDANLDSIEGMEFESEDAGNDSTEYHAGGEDVESEENSAEHREDDQEEVVEKTPDSKALVAHNGGEVLEPFVGMEFESEEAAKIFYNSYATRIGFIMRVSSYFRSKVDGSLISRKFVCNKQGFRMKKEEEGEKPKRARATTREGCEAMMMVKRRNHGKWVVWKFEKEHCHTLVINPGTRRDSLRSLTLDEKDKKIQELNLELKRAYRRIGVYRERLLTVMKDIDEHKQQLSKKVEAMENSIRELDKSKNIHNI